MTLRGDYLTVCNCLAALCASLYVFLASLCASLYSALCALRYALFCALHSAILPPLSCCVLLKCVYASGELRNALLESACVPMPTNVPRPAASAPTTNLAISPTPLIAPRRFPWANLLNVSRCVNCIKLLAEALGQTTLNGAAQTQYVVLVDRGFSSWGFS